MAEVFAYSVIIPTYQEEDCLRNCIRQVRGITNSVEIVVSDGGSSDATPRIAMEEGSRFVSSPLGRGPQCNAGVLKASGEILLFLHADTSLPPNAFNILDRYFSDPSVQVGSFRLAFDNDHLLLRFFAWFSRLDSIFTRFGDQCIVVRRSYFEQIGGFPDVPLFEDVEFFREARKGTTIQVFPSPVITSARRFIRNGIIRQQIANGYAMIKYLLGTSAEDLAGHYDKGKPPCLQQR